MQSPSPADVPAGEDHAAGPSCDGLRVLVAHPSPDLYGSDKTLVESIGGMVEQGARVIVTLPEHGPLEALLESAGATCAVVPVPVLRKSLLSPLGLAKLGGATLRALPAMSRLLRGADVVYVNTVTVPLWLAAAAVRRVPALGHVHEVEEEAAKPLQWALLGPLLLSGSVLVNSESAARWVGRTVPALTDRVQVVYNGVPGPFEPAPLRESLDGPVRLALVGRLSPRKGSDVAVEAVKLLAERGYDVRLLLVGAVFPGYEWYEQELRDAAGGSPAVEFFGFREDVWPSLAEADIALVPSRMEPFGNVAVEAMLAGRPVVASRVQGLAEILADPAHGVLVEPEDPAALADAIATLIKDWPASRAMAARARESALARFAPSRYRRDVAAAVASLADKQSRR